MSCGTHATAEVSFPLLFRSMRGTFRAVAPLFAASSAASSRLSPVLAPSLPRNPPSPLRRLLSALPPMSNHSPAATPPSAAGSLLESSSFKKQFDDFRVQLEESGNVRERIRAVVMEVEAAVRLMHSSLLLVHHTVPNSEVLDKARAQIEVLKGVFHKLTDILRDCPGQYYRYHGDWRSETQTSVSLIAFLHWLETGNLLVHAEAEKKLGLDKSEFGLDVEDYLIGLCFMSNELPRYVVNQVTAGNYDCPRKVLMFLTDLHAAFRMLNLRNDFLRKKFDGMKYDLRRVEEVYYDVKIRGLGAEDSILEQNTQT